MYKRLLSAITAFTLVFTGALLPAGQTLLEGSVIKASAETYGDFSYDVLYDGTVMISGYTGEDIEVIIPSTIDGKSVTGILDWAFSHCTKPTSITIPDSVKSIGNGAFYGCTSLASITIPDTVTIIGDYTFEGCTSLTGVTIPNGVKTIGIQAFSKCENISEIIIPDSVWKIEYGAFKECSCLTNVVIGNKVARIGDSAFSNCTKLKNIIIPENVVSIGGEAFYNTPWLDELRSKNPLVIINNILVDGETSEGDVVIPDYVTKISNWAFAECTGITSVSIPNGIISIQDGTFWDCSNLKSVTIPDSVRWVESGAFKGCSSLTKIIIPNSVEGINTYAFKGCSDLINIVLSDSVELIINYEAFLSCPNLKSVTIPQGVKEIEEKAFGYYYDENDQTFIKVDGFKIYCYKDTAGEKYAIDNGFDYELISDEVSVSGSITLHGSQDTSALTLTATNSEGEEFVIPVNDDGTFEFAGLADGEYTLTATMKNHASSNAVFEVRKGTPSNITLELYQHGDSNHDGVVDRIDANLLSRYVAGWDGYEERINKDVCDLNGDGNVDRIDANILSRCVADWDGYKEKYIN